MSTLLIAEWQEETRVRQFGDRGARALKSTLSKAGNDAIRAMRASSVRHIRERKRLKAGKVNKALVLGFPRGARAIDDLEWKLTVSGRAIPLAAYPFRATKRRGVRVEVNKGAPKFLAHAFVVTTKSGHVGIFMREGPGRLPIHELLSTKITDLFDDRGMLDAVQARGVEVFKGTFSRLFQLEFDKLEADFRR